MLILTRKIGESIHIGDDVKLTVLENDGSQVRIGIAAPKSVPVHREEIYYRIKHEQEMSGSQPDSSAEGNDSPEEEIDDNFGNTKI